MIDFEGILRFWFGERDEPRAVWWEADAAFDDEIRARFAPSLAEVLHGRHPPKPLTRDQRLALIILTDQLSRNMHRGTPRAFESDAYAFDAAQHIIASGQDTQLTPIRRWFVYMPFEHSESIRVQGQSLLLFRQLAAEAPELRDALRHAEEHYETIARFGRFPTRNVILGRTSSPEERAFLASKGAAS